ncbi:MAG: hypothetical protein R2724_05010 [Bryobacterales bacterium]
MSFQNQRAYYYCEVRARNAGSKQLLIELMPGLPGIEVLGPLY